MRTPQIRSAREARLYSESLGSVATISHVKLTDHTIPGSHPARMGDTCGRVSDSGREADGEHRCVQIPAGTDHRPVERAGGAVRHRLHLISNRARPLALRWARRNASVRGRGGPGQGNLGTATTRITEQATLTVCTLEDRSEILSKPVRRMYPGSEYPGNQQQAAFTVASDRTLHHPSTNSAQQIAATFHSSLIPPHHVPGQIRGSQFLSDASLEMPVRRYLESPAS